MVSSDNKGAQPLAEQLLEQHIQFELKALSGQRLKKDLKAEVGLWFAAADELTLGELVSVETIMGVIQRNVIDMELEGGIPDIAGEMARQVFDSPRHRDTHLSEILTSQQFSEFIEELLLLREQRERLLTHLMDHPLYGELVSNLVYHGIVSYLYEDNLLSRKVPGVGSMMKFSKRMFSKTLPGLDSALEKRLKQFISNNLQFLVRLSDDFLQSALTDEQLHESAMDLWRLVEDKPLGELQSGMNDWELSEFIVLGYEFWLRFRKTPYFEHCCLTVVNHLLALYGDWPVGELLADLGVTQEMALTEAQTWIPPLLATLRKKGYLEALLRRRLAPFYASAAARKVLDAGS